MDLDGGAEAEHALARLVEEGAPADRLVAAVRAVAARGRTAAQPLLERLWVDGAVPVRFAAGQALLELGVYDPLLQGFASGRPLLSLCVQAVFLEDPATAFDRLSLLFPQRPEVLHEALRLLAVRGGAGDRWLAADGRWVDLAGKHSWDRKLGDIARAVLVVAGPDGEAARERWRPAPRAKKAMPAAKPSAPSALPPTPAPAPVTLHAEEVDAWVTRSLGPVEPGAVARLRAALERAPAELQIAVLKRCVARMPEIRQTELGSALYGAAVWLYARDLPIAEVDLVDVLETARHDCGHGADVQPPIDLAVAFSRRHGVTVGVLDGLQRYASALTGLKSVQANHAKRRLALLSVLDPRPPRRVTCWSDGFRVDLGQAAAEEQLAWHRFVLGLPLNDQRSPGRAWLGSAGELVRSLGAGAVLDRLERSWPRGEVRLGTGGSNLLKNLVWLLEVVAEEDPEARPRCDALAVALTEVTWRPPAAAEKVAVVAAGYLAERPPEVALAALERLADRWSDGAHGASAIRRTATAYRARHDLG